MLVSVYTPTKNRKGLLVRAVESVLAQTYPDFELLIVNDGSTDDTHEYLDGLARRDPRVKCFHNEQSKGASHCRNVAIRAATGEFVTGLDDDDWFHPYRLAALLDYWRLLSACGETFSCVFTQEVYVCGENRSDRPKRGGVKASDLCFHNMIGNQIFARKETFLEAGLFDESMSILEDLDLFIRVLAKCGPARLLDSGLHFTSLDERPDRVTMGSRAKRVAAYRKMIEKHPGFSEVEKQGLFLQTFSRIHRDKPGFGDFVEFFRYGINFRTLKTLFGICLR